MSTCSTAGARALACYVSPESEHVSQLDRNNDKDDCFVQPRITSKIEQSWQIALNSAQITNYAI